MNHHDAEIADVLVVLSDELRQDPQGVIELLVSVGLRITDTNSEEGVVEGSIDAGRVGELKKITGVAYVRSVFTYFADFPAGDPRDTDGPEEPIDDRD